MRVEHNPVRQHGHLLTPSIVTPTNLFVCIITRVRPGVHLDQHTVNADLRFPPSLIHSYLSHKTATYLFTHDSFPNDYPRIGHSKSPFWLSGETDQL